MLWIGIGIGIAVVVVILVVLAAIATVATSINITAVNYSSSDNACGTAGTTGPGTSMSSGGTAQDTLVVTNLDFILSCTISTVSTPTPGFSVSGANVPLTIPAGGQESLSFTIHAPSGSFNGVLTIDIE